MSEDSAVRADLLQRVEARRAGVQAWLSAERPKVRRRANWTIVLSTLAALSTAGPAVGGESFAEGVQRSLGLSSDSIVWRVLCLVALLVSVGAAILTNLGKSQDLTGRLATAEAGDGELEGLAVLLQFGQLPVQDAVKLYQQYTVKLSFVPDTGVGPGTRPVALAEPAPVDGARRPGGPLPAVPPPVRRPERPEPGPPPR